MNFRQCKLVCDACDAVADLMAAGQLDEAASILGRIYRMAAGSMAAKAAEADLAEREQARRALAEWQPDPDSFIN